MIQELKRLQKDWLLLGAKSLLKLIEPKKISVRERVEQEIDALRNQYKSYIILPFAVELDWELIPTLKVVFHPVATDQVIQQVKAFAEINGLLLDETHIKWRNAEELVSVIRAFREKYPFSRYKTLVFQSRVNPNTLVVEYIHLPECIKNEIISLAASFGMQSQFTFNPRLEDVD